MPIQTMRDDVILHLADRFGVTVQWVESVDLLPKGQQGPQGQVGCDPSKRTVFFEENPQWDPGPEIYLHELVHVIVQPPWWTITEAPEEFILFQFERALAHVSMDAETVDRVVAWQEETGLSIVGDDEHSVCLCDLPGYRRLGFWRRGFALCRSLGLIDSRNRPTFKNPDWSQLKGQEEELARYYRLPLAKPLEGGLGTP